MNYVIHANKGTIGYIRKQTVFEIIKTIILFIMALGLFFIGYYTLHTKKSLWSVLAVLALLPACRSLVGVIMFARFRSVSDADADVFKKAAGSMSAVYENILTTSSMTYYLPVIVVSKGTVIAYSLKSYDSSLKEHIENVLKTGGHKATVKIFDDKDAFINRCGEMQRIEDGSQIAACASIINTIKAVSL